MFSLVQNLTSALKAYEAKNISDHKNQKRNKLRHFNSYQSKNKNSLIDREEAQNGTEFSIRSLIWFFEDYLSSRLVKEDKTITEHISHDLKPWMKTAHSNSNAEHPPPEKVAGLYDKNHVTFTDTDSTFISDLGDNEMRNELKDIYFLIQDLRILNDNGVENLFITYDQPFIHGVISAVDQIKNAS